MRFSDCSGLLCRFRGRRIYTLATPAAGGGPGGRDRDRCDGQVAEEYVKLVLALGQHDADYVDAYYGPPEWKTGRRNIEARPGSLIARRAPHESRRGAGRVERQPARRDAAPAAAVPRAAALGAVRPACECSKGERLSFDEESRALYDAVAPTHPESHFQEILDRLEKRFPGNGPLVERYEAFRRDSSSRATSSIRSSSARSRRAASGRCSTSRCRRTSNSRSSTSRTSPGAATTGIRAATAA